MAKGRPNLTDCVPAGLRLLEHPRANGGGNDGEQALAFLSGPQARLDGLRDLGGLPVRAN